MQSTATEPAAAQAHRDVVGSYESYGEAQGAIDVLSGTDFPIERASIVAHGMRFVEDVTGRRTYRDAAVHGMLTGASVGAWIGFILGLLSLVDPLVNGFLLAMWGLLLGAIAGLIAGPLVHAMTDGSRDFSAVGRIEADRYDVIVDHGVADRARTVLRAAPTTLQRRPAARASRR